jgi:hypothetical protein
MDDRKSQYLARVDAVEQRLTAQARPLAGLSAEDATTGERWEAGQVWGHITEFVPYWIEEIEEVVDQYRGEPVPFGRITTDPDRLAGIEAGPAMDFDTHLHWLGVHLTDLRGFLAALPDDAWSVVGLHSRSGAMSLDQMIERMLVGHLEEHADQLEGMAVPAK